MISELKDIVLQYLSISDYSICFGHNPSYSWKKYFNNKLPSIYEAIKLDSVNLVKYLEDQGESINLELNYEDIELKSVGMAKFLLAGAFLNEDLADWFIGDAILNKNYQVFEYLFTLSLELSTQSLYELLELAGETLFCIKKILAYAKNNLDKDRLESVEEDFIKLTSRSKNKKIKKFVKTLDYYKNNFQDMIIE